MTPSQTYLPAIAQLARARGLDLPPFWDAAASSIAGDEVSALNLFCEASGWPPARALDAHIRAHGFPILAYSEGNGWAVAKKFEAGGFVAVQQGNDNLVWRTQDVRLFDVLIPTPAGQQHHARALDVFLAAILKRKSVLVTAGLATLVINVIALATSLFSMQVYDRVVPLGAFSTLLVLGFGTAVAIGFDFILRVVRTNLLEEEAVHIDTEVSEFFFARANDVRLDARPPSIGTMAAQLRGLEQVRAMLSSSSLFLLADLPFALLFIFIVAQLGGVIALVMLVSFPISIGLAFLFARWIRDDTAKAQVSGNKKNGLLVEALDAAETIKGSRGHWFMMARWSALLDELHDAELPIKQRQALAGTIFGSIQQLAYVALIGWGAVEVFNNNMTMGALIACSILAGRINGPLIGQLPNLLVQWSYSRSSLDMLDGILRLPSERAPGQDLLRPAKLRSALQVQDVVFQYQGAKAGVVVPRLSINPGERIGVIGGIGSGKSTLLRLLAGLYAPSQGSVLIDKLDMRHVAEDVLRQAIGYLPQEYRLINGTLRDNLVLGLADPGDTAVMAAAEATGLAGLIAAHPRGLDLPISEGGRGLSGGQRVLTGLTRLMLAKPNLWLLDEPTANLDVDTEMRVLQAIQRQLDAEASLVLVTHKFQLLGLVSRVIVIANGQIVMDGPTKEILERLQRPAEPAPPKKPSATIVGVKKS